MHMHMYMYIQVALLMLKLAFFSGLSLILTVVPLHATAAWGASTVQLGRITSFVTLLSLVASPLAGFLADRVGRRQLKPKPKPEP